MNTYGARYENRATNPMWIDWTSSPLTSIQYQNLIIQKFASMNSNNNNSMDVLMHLRAFRPHHWSANPTQIHQNAYQQLLQSAVVVTEKNNKMIAIDGLFPALWLMHSNHTNSHDSLVLRKKHAERNIYHFRSCPCTRSTRMHISLKLEGQCIDSYLFALTTKYRIFSRRAQTAA